MTEREMLELMAEYPALIRRPLLIAESGAVVGFNRPALERFLKAIGAEDGENDA